MLLPKHAWGKSPFVNNPLNFTLLTIIGALNISKPMTTLLSTHGSPWTTYWISWQFIKCARQTGSHICSLVRSTVQLRNFAYCYFFSSLIYFRHMVGLLWRVISSSQGLYLHRTTQHRQRRTSIYALSGIGTHDPVYERSRPAHQTARTLDRPVHKLLNCFL
jgi:hypothetical protein